MLTVVVAALTIRVIWVLVRELVRVLLPVLFAAGLFLNCLSLLEEDRLVFSSLMTEEERVLEEELEPEL